MKSYLELKYTLKLIDKLDSEIAEIESRLKRIMDEIASPILLVPSIVYCIWAIIHTEIRTFSRFESPDKLLGYVNMSPLALLAQPNEIKFGSRHLYSIPIKVNRHLPMQCNI